MFKFFAKMVENPPTISEAYAMPDPHKKAVQLAEKIKEVEAEKQPDNKLLGEVPADDKTETSPPHEKNAGFWGKVNTVKGWLTTSLLMMFIIVISYAVISESKGLQGLVWFPYKNCMGDILSTDRINDTPKKKYTALNYKSANDCPAEFKQVFASYISTLRSAVEYDLSGMTKEESSLFAGVALLGLFSDSVGESMNDFMKEKAGSEASIKAHQLKLKQVAISYGVKVRY